MYSNSNFYIMRICPLVVPAILTGVLYLTVALMHVSLINQGCEYLLYPLTFVYLLWRNVSLNCVFAFQLDSYLCRIVKGSGCDLSIRPLSAKCRANVSSHCLGYHFTSLVISFALLTLWVSNMRKHWDIQGHWVCSWTFLLEFSVVALTFETLSNELIFI